MEPSEANSVPTSPTKDSENDDTLAIQHSLPSSNGDPVCDPDPNDLDHAAQEVGEIEEQLGKMGLKEKEEEEEEVVESSLKEEEEEVDGADGDSDGGEKREKENGKREEESDGGENQDGNENENENESEVEVVIEIEVDVDNGDELENNDEGSDSRRNQYPVRPEAEDCSFYLKTGTCKFGSNCKFNHPVRRKNNQVQILPLSLVSIWGVGEY